MSNVGRPREGMKKCVRCNSTKRDSNGQCACRNVLYRALRNVIPAKRAKIVAFYDEALKTNKGNVAKALAATREDFPSIAPAKKAPAKKTLTKRQQTIVNSRKAAIKKAAASEKAQREAEDEAVKKARKEADKAILNRPEAKNRYVLTGANVNETSTFARKDAAIKNGIRSGGAWTVTRNGKVVASSEDL